MLHWFWLDSSSATRWHWWQFFCHIGSEIRSNFEISGSIKFNLWIPSIWYITCHTFDHNDLRGLKKCGVYCAAINCHNARRNCKLSMFWFPKDAESGYKIVDKMIWELFQYKAVPLSVVLQTIWRLSIHEQKKYTHLEYNTSIVWCSKSPIRSHTILANQS